MPREAWSSKMKGRNDDSVGGGCLARHKNARNDRGFKRMDRERQPADTNSWGGNIFGNLI